MSDNCQFSSGNQSRGSVGYGPQAVVEGLAPQGQPLAYQVEASAVVEGDGGVEAPRRWNSTWDRSPSMPVKETRVPRPAAPGLSAAYDYEYERNGVSSLFMLFAPLDGWRRVEVRERRTKVDWAHVIKKLVDEDYPDRDRIVLVMDNLNTHKLSSLYEAFELGKAAVSRGGYFMLVDK